MTHHINKRAFIKTSRQLLIAIGRIIEQSTYPILVIAGISEAGKKSNPASVASVQKEKIILVTGHRRESFGEGLEHICLALKHIAQHEDDVQIIYPVHLNPHVQRQVKKILRGVKNIHLIEPLEYDAFVYLMNRSYVILTDSGGIQEEAPSLGKPVLVMRRETERPEGVEAGVSKVVGTNKESIVNVVGVLLHDRHEYEKMSNPANPYGDGRASERIIEALRLYFKMS